MARVTPSSSTKKQTKATPKQRQSASAGPAPSEETSRSGKTAAVPVDKTGTETAPEPPRTTRRRNGTKSTEQDPSAPPEQKQRRRRSSDPSQRRDPERTRQLILDAASEEFGNVGYEGARVMRIAERAGVAHQLITYHFGGKQGLFDALSERWARESESNAAGEKRADAIIADLVHQAGRSSSWARALVREGQQGHDHARLMERLMPVLDSAKELQARGELPADVDAGIATLVFFAANTAPVTLPHVTRALSPIDPSDPSFVDFYAAQLGRIMKHLGEYRND